MSFPNVDSNMDNENAKSNRDGGIRTRDPLNPISVGQGADAGMMPPAPSGAPESAGTERTRTAPEAGAQRGQQHGQVAGLSQGARFALHLGRRCPRCSHDLPLDAFGTRTRRGKRTPLPYCRPCMVAYHREWRATEAGAAKFAAGESASKARHPDRMRARHQVRAAIARGTLERGPCYAAGNDCTGAVEAHHDDYSRPLTVVWTCRGHHRALDQARRERDAQPMERAA